MVEHYKILFFTTLFLLFLSGSFLIYQIYQNNINLKNSIPTEKEIFCGGITGKSCPNGYGCQLDGNYPDAGGKCVKAATPTGFSCPGSEWINCMPSPNQPQNYQCEKPFLDWAKANCPNFKRAAL